MSKRNALTARHCNDLTKAASALEKFPFSMERGARYLRTLVRENMPIEWACSHEIESGGDPPPWQLPPLGWVAGRTDAEDGIDPALCPVDDADADLACAVDTHLQATRPQMISIHPNALLHVPKHRITGKRKRSFVSEGHGAPTCNLEPSAPPGAGILVQATGAAKAEAKAKCKRPASAGPDAAPPLERHTRAPRGNRRRIDFAEPPEPDARLGCGTCKQGRRGCRICRKRKGMVVRDGCWVWPLPQECPLD